MHGAFVTDRSHARSTSRSAKNSAERIVKLTRGDLVNYAGVSGDANPIHWSDEVVKLAGLDNVVAHGMLTMGLGGGFVTSWLGDPGAVKEYNVRFTSPVYVREPTRPREVEFTGKVKSRRRGKQDSSSRDRGEVPSGKQDLRSRHRNGASGLTAGCDCGLFGGAVKYTEISGVTQRCALPYGAVSAGKGGARVM